jgi:hypothetical protein
VRVYGEEVVDMGSKHTILVTLAGIILVAALIAGLMVEWTRFTRGKDNLAAVGREAKGISEDLMIFRDAVRTIETRVNREVVRVRETVRSEVAVLSSDALASALNDELALFRGLFIRPTGGDTDNF